MSEPEDLILDGALAATEMAQRAWRRYVPASPAGVLALADVRVRLELFVHALFGTPIAISPAAPAAPVGWLARLAGRPTDRPAELWPGTDGERIFLPSTLDASAVARAPMTVYQLLAVEQAMRISRGSTAAALSLPDGPVRDCFLVADAIAVDRRVAAIAPGLVPMLIDERQREVARRRVGADTSREHGGLEVLVQAALSREPAAPVDDLPVDGTVEDAIAWARGTAGSVPAGHAQRTALAWYWGRPLATSRSALDSVTGVDSKEPDPATRPSRVSEMRRRPRVRDAENNEDDPGAGTWVVRADEPQESVEDPLGLRRPADAANDVDPDGLGDSLAELPEARVVRTPDRAREVLRAGDEHPGVSARLPLSTSPARLAYPEWDYRAGTYRRPGAVVHLQTGQQGPMQWVDRTAKHHARLIRRVRTRFEGLRPRRTKIDRQADGIEIDIAAFVTATADRRAGRNGDDRLYVAVRPARRELAVALLADVSASTDGWVDGRQRIVDVEKAALLVVCEALDALGDRHAIFAFSGEGPDHIAVVEAKAFSGQLDTCVRRRIAALDADGYTRLGAAIRHATAALREERAGRRLLLILSDGKPNDVDAYEGQYGVEDTRQAVAESRSQDVHVFCLTVDREAPRYAPRIFGPAGFTLLQRPDQLPVVLIEVLRRLIRG